MTIKRLLLILFTSQSCIQPEFYQNMESETYKIQQALTAYKSFTPSKTLQPAVMLAIPAPYQNLVNDIYKILHTRTLPPATLQKMLKNTAFCAKNSPHIAFDNLSLTIEEYLGLTRLATKNKKKTNRLNQKTRLKRVFIAAYQAAVVISKEVNITIKGELNYQNQKGAYNRTTHFGYLIDPQGKKTNFTGIKEYNRTVAPFKNLTPFAIIQTPGYNKDKNTSMGGLLPLTTLYGSPSVPTGSIF